jgi:hypothetical protein
VEPICKRLLDNKNRVSTVQKKASKEDYQTGSSDTLNSSEMLFLVSFQITRK